MSNDMLPCWFALQIRTRLEGLIDQSLRNKGKETFLPVYTIRRRGYDRIREKRCPLFPGYLFCKLDPLDRLPVLTVPGVLRIVGAGSRPLPVDDQEIAAIRQVIDSGYPAFPHPYVEIGQKVHIQIGPLAGVEGILTTVKNDQRLIVSIKLLQRSVAVEVDRAAVVSRERPKISSVRLAAGMTQAAAISSVS